MSEALYTSGDYAALTPTWHAEESPRMLARQRLAPHTVGDIGCGAGEVLHHLQPHLPPDCHLWGYDLAPEAIARAQPLENARLHFRLADIRCEPGVRYDLLLVLDVLEHVEAPFAFLRDIRPRGAATIFHIPLDLSAQTVLRPGALLKMRAAYGHLHYFTKETALAMLRDAGYTIRDTCYTARQIEQPTHVRSTKLLRWPRRMAFAVRPDAAVRLLGGYSLLVLAE